MEPMAKSGKKKQEAPVTDPFEDVEAKSITEIEMDQRVDLEREALPAAAKLTDLPLKWVLIVLLFCIGASELGQRVERKQLIQAAKDSGLIKEEEAEKADEVNQLVKDREKLQDRIRELQKRRDELDKLGEDTPDDAEEPPEIPLTMESLRAEIRRIAGDQYESYRKFATLIALLIGGLGLILLAVFVRVLAAALIGGIAGGAAFFLQVDPWIMYAAAAVGAALGAWLAPRLLLANMLFNVAIAGMVLGATLAGGGVFLATGNELYSIFGLGVGLVVGALIGFKFARPLFLSAVLANAAGFATFVLWLAWGDLYPHFWPITFGGLMIIDAVATRIYHKVRWARG
ncbi:MAG: hypothetical protein KDB82_14585 [Planctomycetes bacterium]|nr:hypothetical protein [Planctomycetota bacterium]